MHGMLSPPETVRRSCANFVARMLKTCKAESGKHCCMSRCFHDTHVNLVQIFPAVFISRALRLFMIINL